MRSWGKSWTIPVTMAVAICGLFLLAITQNAAPPQAAPQNAPAQTAGKPDFSGIWEANNTANWDLLTHEPRPMVGQPGVLPNSVVLAAPVVGLGTIGWVPAGIGIVEGDQIPYQ